MKSTFSRNWKSSVQPRKQRKFRANAPLHTRSLFLHAALSKDLRTKNNVRTLRVRAGDEVRVMRGEFKGVKGEVDSVNTKTARLFIRGVDVATREGSKKPVSVAVSNVRITKLVEDKRRMKNG